MFYDWIPPLFQARKRSFHLPLDFRRFQQHVDFLSKNLVFQLITFAKAVS